MFGCMLTTGVQFDHDTATLHFAADGPVATHHNELSLAHLGL